jgi:hypothetical protein
MPAKKELPSTLQRSPRKAQNTWMKTHDSAVEQYGEGERAHRTAFDSLKRSFEKVGDHWEPKKRKGPSDEQAAQRGPTARNNPKATHGGVDTQKSRNELMNEARSLGVQNYSSMRKMELVDAIDRANRRKTARASQRE